MSADRTAEFQAAIDSADYEGFTTLEQAASDELMRLWGDLHHQMRDARDGCWSVGCESVAHRIAVLTRALGKAARWQDMDIEFLESGVYQRFHDLMGVPYEGAGHGRDRQNACRADSKHQRMSVSPSGIMAALCTTLRPS